LRLTFRFDFINSELKQIGDFRSLIVIYEY
jgi:hypothetical protein